MKFQKIESAGDHERFVLHIGRQETRILIGLLNRARKGTPRVEETTRFLSSVQQMEQEFVRGLKQP